MADILVALGSNLGDRGEALTAAIEALAQTSGITLVAASSFHTTSPVGGPSGQDDFLNAAVRLSSDLSPSQIHQRLIEIERQQGRVRIQRWAARKLDLDLLLYGDAVIHSQSLEVPHPRMSFRRFVLAPAVEVAADMPHPQLGCTLGDLYGILTTSPPVVQIAAAGDPVVETVCRQLAGQLAIETAWRSAEGLDFSAAQTWEDRRQRALAVDEGHSSTVVSTAILVPARRLIAAACRQMEEATSLPESPTPGSLPPRLTVLWEIPWGAASEGTRARLSESDWDRFQQILSEIALAETRGPLLHLRGAAPDAAVTEIAAAIEAAGS